ncbi:MAG: hypothetical protein J5I98_01420 [Phaeodactylibacter sp.]|nr:hypothetical protein [Phaeodactylibacter sp.]
MKNQLLFFLLLLVACRLPAQDEAILPKLEAIAIIDQKVMMPMRDGIRLATDIYRPKTDKPVPVIFSKTPYNFNSWVDGELSTSNYFAPGHRIRIEVSGSNFPRFERNLNTGGNNYDEAEGVVARNKVHHSVKYPSQVRLPVVRR